MSTSPPPPPDEGVGLLRSAVRRDIVDTLANLPEDEREEGLSAQELAGLVGLHVTTVRFHLDQLVDGRLLTSHLARSQGAGRPGKKYAVAPGSIRAAATEEHYQALATVLAEMVAGQDEDGQQVTPESAGAAWARRNAPRLLQQPSLEEPARSPGAWLSKVGLMIDVLREWGYSPTLRTEQEGRSVEVEITGCPFIELAHSQPEVVCGIHRGLMRGTLEVFGEDDTELSLQPFVGPDRCLAHVTTRTGFTRGGTP